MGTEWTEEQRKVIDLRNRSMLVSAAAGSGKTAVLVERILSRVLDPEHPVDIDRILVVTFTNAAAAQMRERILRSMEQKLEEHPEDQRLRRQTTLIHNAHIETIDSFCLQVVRSHFHRIDLEPGFRIADQGEIKLIKGEVCDRVMEWFYAEKDPEFLTFADNYSSAGKDEGIQNMILSLYEYANSYPWPEEWLESCLQSGRADTLEEMDEKPWMRQYIGFFRQMTEEYLQTIEQLLRICREPGGPDKYEAALESDRTQLSELLERSGYSAWQQGLKELTFAKLGRCGKETDPEWKDYVKNQRDAYKEDIRSHWKKYFAADPEEQKNILQDTAEMLQVLVRMTRSFAEEFTAVKRKKNILDFSDMEHFALQILLTEEEHQPTEIAREYQELFEEIMIDEYQDSNYVQEALLQAVSRESDGEQNVFMVGDVKQSIYRFRMARSELFMEKYHTYQTANSPHQRIDLHKNFRSRPEVLDFANRIFARVMREDIGNITYDREAALYPGGNFADDPAGNYDPEVILLEKQKGMDAAESEARAAALKIRQMVEEQVIEGLTYGDIVILMRSPKKWAPIYQSVFADAGIPFLVTADSGYFSAREVQVLLAYLKILDNPMQDIPLTVCMTGFFGKFSSDDLARIKAAYPYLTFAESVFAYGGRISDTLTSRIPEELFLPAEEPDPELAARIGIFLDTLEIYRSRVPDTPIHRLMEEIMRETGYYQYQAALPAGRRRKANLDMLLEKAVAYEQTSYQGLMHFNRYIEELHKYEVDFGEAETAETHENAVHLYSIHKSKGLEFPVVLLGQTGKKFNTNDQKGDLILHPEYGAALRYRNRAEHRRRDTILKNALTLEEKRDSLGEELRILYVALTRAEKKVIVMGTLEKLPDGENEPDREEMGIFSGESQPLPFAQRFSAVCYMEWVLGAIRGDASCHREIWKPEDLDQMEARYRSAVSRESARILEESYEGDRTMMQELEHRFAWKYPWADRMLRRQKVSVSDLKHRAMAEQMRAFSDVDEPELLPQKEPEPHIPAFIQASEENGGALYGTAMHRLLECIDYTELPETGDLYAVLEAVEKQMETLYEAGRIDAQIRARIDRKRAAAFFCTDLARRMRRAQQKGCLHREQPFVMSIEASRVWEEAENEETVLTQGIIDAFWEEEDGIVLLDYKTDRVSDPEELRQRYSTQLKLYQEAISRRYHGSAGVKETLIYSFALQTVIPL